MLEKTLSYLTSLSPKVTNALIGPNPPPPTSLLELLPRVNPSSLFLFGASAIVINQTLNTVKRPDRSVPEVLTSVALDVMGAYTTLAGALPLLDKPIDSPLALTNLAIAVNWLIPKVAGYIDEKWQLAPYAISFLLGILGIILSSNSVEITEPANLSALITLTLSAINYPIDLVIEKSPLLKNIAVDKAVKKAEKEQQERNKRTKRGII